MGNHSIDCPYCHEDMRGLSGVRGCQSAAEASKCHEYAKLGAAERGASLPEEDELSGILHKAFSHPDAIDHSAEVVGMPKLVRTKGGWYVLGEDGMRFNLVCAHRDPSAPSLPAGENGR